MVIDISIIDLSIIFVTMERLNEIIFYSIDKAIRTYRQFAQQELKKAGFKITIDQWLVIKNILEHPDLPQNELADKVFKDSASITRIIALLVKAGYLERQVKTTDRRRSHLKITREGRKIIERVQGVVLKNRATALHGIPLKQLTEAQKTMEIIAKNCLT